MTAVAGESRIQLLIQEIKTESEPVELLGAVLPYYKLFPGIYIGNDLLLGSCAPGVLPLQTHAILTIGGMGRENRPYKKIDIAGIEHKMFHCEESEEGFNHIVGQLESIYEIFKQHVDSGNTIVIHSSQGVNRGVAVLAMCLVKMTNLPFDRVHRAIQRKCPRIVIPYNDPEYYDKKERAGRPNFMRLAECHSEGLLHKS